MIPHDTTPPSYLRHRELLSVLTPSPSVALRSCPGCGALPVFLPWKGVYCSRDTCHWMVEDIGQDARLLVHCWNARISLVDTPWWVAIVERLRGMVAWIGVGAAWHCTLDGRIRGYLSTRQIVSPLTALACSEHGVFYNCERDWDVAAARCKIPLEQASILVQIEDGSGPDFDVHAWEALLVVLRIRQRSGGYRKPSMR